jgi:hypothetical protein
MEITKAVLDKIKGIKLDPGMLTDCEKNNISYAKALEDKLLQADIMSDCAGMKGFDRLEAKRHARENGKAFPVSAFDLFMKANGGSFSDTVAKWISTPNLQTLFVEYFASRLYIGAMATNLVPYLCSQRVSIDGFKFEAISLEVPTKDKKMRKIGAGQEIPKVKITIGNQSIWLAKFGIGVEATYEQMASQRLDYIGAMWQVIGRQVGLDLTWDFINTLLNGDGNSNGLQNAQIKTTATTGTIVKKDLFTFWRALPDGYSMNVFVGSKANMILVDDCITSLTNPGPQLAAVMTDQRRSIPAGYEYNDTMVKSGSTVTDYLVGHDKDNTGVYVTNDAMMLQESEKIISRQVQETYATMYGDLRINDKNSIGVLDIIH